MEKQDEKGVQEPGLFELILELNTRIMTECDSERYRDNYDRPDWKARGYDDLGEGRHRRHGSDRGKRTFAAWEDLQRILGDSGIRHHPTKYESDLFKRYRAKEDAQQKQWDKERAERERARRAAGEARQREIEARRCAVRVGRSAPTVGTTESGWDIACLMDKFKDWGRTSGYGAIAEGLMWEACVVATTKGEAGAPGICAAAVAMPGFGALAARWDAEECRK